MSSTFQHPNRPEIHRTPDLADPPSLDRGGLETSRECRPFGWPDIVERNTAELWSYWDRLKRGNAEMPFSDDIKLGEIPRLAGGVFLLRVFENPRRFRFDAVGPDVGTFYQGNLEGEFVNEIQIRRPVDYLVSQCHATLEARAPTFYRSAPTPEDRDGYNRALFPFWGDGHIDALMGIITGFER
jgi:hypothetical protein